jgi:hypothetical protein
VIPDSYGENQVIFATTFPTIFGLFGRRSFNLCKRILSSTEGVGATLMLYDGFPFHPQAGGLWKMAQDHKVTIFGTSAGYIATLMAAGVKPGKEYDLTPL